MTSRNYGLFPIFPEPKSFLNLSPGDWYKLQFLIPVIALTTCGSVKVELLDPILRSRSSAHQYNTNLPMFLKRILMSRNVYIYFIIHKYKITIAKVVKILKLLPKKSKHKKQSNLTIEINMI